MNKKKSIEQIDMELLTRIDERQQRMMQTVSEIHAEVKKTNGRVLTIEEWKRKHEIEFNDLSEEVDYVSDYQNKQKGAWTATKVIVGAVGFIVGCILTYFLKA